MSRLLPIEELVVQAAATGVSDVVAEPQDDGSLAVVARRDGLRTRLGLIPTAAAAQAVARLKALANLPAYITDEPQDGAIAGEALGIAGDIRLACLPTVRGQRLALRLPVLGALPTPEDLHLDPQVLRTLRAALRRREGLILVTGPTGSGKTTTIHSLLAELAAERSDRQVVTIEDPVERRIPGLAQVAVAPGRGFGYGEALAAALRQDADVLVVGEVRDRTTAAACLTAALTGHLVISTLHCGRAAEAVRRLIDLGVDPDHLRSALSLVLAQRLLRRRHDACGGRGCGACLDGFAGRLPVCDLLLVDADNRHRLALGQPPLLDADLDSQAAALVVAGRTTTAEVARSMA
jgi:type II secretory ATPase GspE/PulE/Tfp pilus assembly ATPase PilB-like protein